jgi:hypothetical protein
MLLAEDLLVLLVPTTVGELPRRSGTQAALAAALLVELAGAGRLAVEQHVDDEDDFAMVTVADPTPLGEEILDGALAIVAAEAPAEVEQLIGLLVPGLYVRLLDRLVARGLLARTTRPLTFGVASKHVWRVADHGRREWLRRWLCGVAFGQIALDQWSGVLIGLLGALDAIDEVGVGNDKAARGRITEIAEGGWAGDEISKAINEAGLRALAGKTHIIDSMITFPG